MPILWTQSVGLQIAGDDLRVVLIRQSFSTQRLAKTEVLAGFAGLPEEERARVFKAFVKQHRFPPSRVYLTLAKDVGIVRQMEFPVQIIDRIEAAVALQIETLSPWPLNEVYWSCSFERPPKGSKFLRATIVIVPRATLDPWIEFFRKAEFPLRGASIPTSAWAHGAAVLWGASLSVILLGCEQESLEGVLVSRGQLAAASADRPKLPEVLRVSEVPLAVAPAVAGEVLEGVDVPEGNPAFEDAESPQSDTASPLSRQARLLVERLLSLGGISSSEGVTLFAHGSAAQDLDSDSARLPLEGAGSDSPHYFGAIATALLGLRKSAFDVNLVPAALRYRHSRALLAPTFVLAFLAVLLGAFWFGRAPYQTLIYAEQIDREIDALVPQVKDLAGQEAVLEKLNQHFVTLNAHIRNRDANLEALRELSRVLPPDTWINSYSSQDFNVSISGLSSSAAQVQKALEDSPVFKDAQQTATLIKDPTGKDRFSIRAAVEPAR